MTDRIDPKAIADELRAGCGNGCKTASSVMHSAADTIDALVKERDMRASESADLERQRDELAAVVEKVRGVIGAEIGWESPAILIDRIQWALSTAPADALAEHDARLIEGLAELAEAEYSWGSWALVRATPQWLRERARQVREGDKK